MCALCGLAQPRRTTSNMCTIKYTQKYLLATYVRLHPFSPSPWLDRERTGIMAYLYAAPATPPPLSAQGSAIPMGFHVPDARPSMVAISQHDKSFQPAPASIPFLSFSPLLTRSCTCTTVASHPPPPLRLFFILFFFARGIGRMLLGDDATEEEGFIRSSSGLRGWKYRTN